MELRNAALLVTPPIRDLFARAFEGPADATDEEARTWTQDHLGDPLAGVLLAETEGRFDGLALLWAHVGPFAPLPWVIHFYAGAPGVRKALAEAVVAWMAERGYDRARAINRTGASDEVYARLFRPVGEVKRLGTLVEFIT